MWVLYPRLKRFFSEPEDSYYNRRGKPSQGDFGRIPRESRTPPPYKCGVRSSECGLRNAECGITERRRDLPPRHHARRMQIAEWGMRNNGKTAQPTTTTPRTENAEWRQDDTIYDHEHHGRRKQIEECHSGSPYGDRRTADEESGNEARCFTSFSMTSARGPPANADCGMQDAE